MEQRFAGETANLVRSWQDVDRATLREYLVQDVEDPRVNLQSIFTRHFLLDSLFPGRFALLRYHEVRFSAVLNWVMDILRNFGPRRLPEIYLALAEGRSELDGLFLPGYVRETLALLPAAADGQTVDNYLSAALLGAGEASAVPDFVRDTFRRLWSAALASCDPPARLSVLEPACGSANDYRFLHGYGLARFLDYRGFDLTAGNIANARAMFPAVPFEVGNILALDLPDRAVDCLFVHDLFEHLSLAAMEHALAETCRVTRRGLCLNFFRLAEAPEHLVVPHEHYFVNTLSLPRVLALLEARGWEAEVLQVGQVLQGLFDKRQTHNPLACTLLGTRKSP